MTLNTDLQAARQRVSVQQQQLEDARASLAIAEHQAYSDALQLIADEVRDAVAEPQRGDADGFEALGNIGLVLEGIGVKPSAKPQQTAPVAVRR